MPRLFCFGLGFSALTFARHMQQQGWQVAGTCRSEEKAEVLRAEGFDVYLFGDAPLADPAQALAGTTHLLASVPPGDDGDPVVGTHGKDIQTVSSLEWIGYLSTTGVYGDRKGGFVNETSMLLPSTERGKKRVTAELVWQDLAAAMNVPLHMFRLAGIYGPGRNQLVSLRKGKARRVEKPGQVFSRIHVDDIAQILEAAATSGLPTQPFNVCDNEASPPQDVVAYAADLLGIDPPPLVPFDEVEMSPMGRSFYAESKRVKNDRIKDDLDVVLKYPTYREGLQALADDGDGKA
ncbi:MAG: SDR family oxidoreductase [Alphaproteobacteria bacterium]|nr:SDR family oxidoreductase [Alphaproteobacteria bacterium]